MENIDFGNYLYRLRKDSNLTQRYVAYQLDVSDKAVSKWEMGKSKPDLEKLKKLSVLYGVSLDELLDIQEKKREFKINKIVLTGGPCAGKTTALTWISNYFSKSILQISLVEYFFASNFALTFICLNFSGLLSNECSVSLMLVLDFIHIPTPFSSRNSAF